MKTLQNFFKTTITTTWATGTGNRYIATLPTPSTGWLVISPNSTSLREIVAYTATGTDGGGNYITVSARGVGGTTEQTHDIGESVRMNITAQHWADLYVDPIFTGTVTVPTPTNSTDAVTKAYADGIAVAGGADASTTVKGIAKASVAPASAANPIFVGDNDPRMLTQGENDAAAGTSGTPSSTNKYVTNDDTTGTGAVQRASVLANYSLSKTTFTAGAAITAGQAVAFSRYTQSDGGILLDNQTATFYSATTNQSQSFTVASNSNRALLVGVLSTSLPTNVTYNSVAMTLVDSQAMSGNTLYVYKLAAPATGTNNIVVTATGINGIMAASYYNVSQASLVEAFAKATAGTGSPTVNITTLSSGAFVHSFIGVSGLTGISSYSVTTSSKYNSTNSATSVNGTFTNPTVVSSTIGKFNETQTISIAGTQVGGSGFPGDGIIVVSLAPATAMTLGVVPTNATASTLNVAPINFVGFADATVAVGASVSVTTAGVVTGLSGLTPGEKYYLGTSNGTISTTSSTYGKEIGYALSATTLMISPQKTIGSPISKVVTYVYTAESDGFLTSQAIGGTFTIVGLVTQTAVTNASGSSVQIPLTGFIKRGSTYNFTGGGGNFYPLV